VSLKPSQEEQAYWEAILKKEGLGLITKPEIIAAPVSRHFTKRRKNNLDADGRQAGTDPSLKPKN
jgi:hypothetical protein